jgi:hypothetical protein
LAIAMPTVFNIKIIIFVLAFFVFSIKSSIISSNSKGDKYNISCPRYGGMYFAY